MGFPCGLGGKESACNSADLGSISGLGRSRGEGKGSPLQYSGLENSFGPWGREESDTTERLSLHFTCYNILGKAPYEIYDVGSDIHDCFSCQNMPAVTASEVKEMS